MVSLRLRKYRAMVDRGMDTAAYEAQL